MNHFKQLLFAATAMILLANAVEAQSSDSKLRILILSGQNNHNWRETTSKLRSILEISGRFTVDITEHPERSNAADFHGYDALLSNWNTFGEPVVASWPDATRQAFLNFVKDGKGLISVHAGSSSFYDWPEYQQLTGASWKLGQTGHGPVHEFTVKPVANDHPITRGMTSFLTTDELWHQTGLEPDIRILATAYSAADRKGSGRDEPVAIIIDYGQGRCFNLLLGHDVRAMESNGFQLLLLRGAEWAASGKVSLVMPPTKEGSNP